MNKILKVRTAFLFAGLFSPSLFKFRPAAFRARQLYEYLPQRAVYKS